MKRKFIKCLYGVMIKACVLISLSACSDQTKWDSFKDYMKDGEIMYTGKLDSVKVFSGNERVRFSTCLPADPKVTKIKVLWNDGKESAEYDVDIERIWAEWAMEGGSGRPLFEVYTPIEEGVHSFTLYTYDALGVASVPVHVTGRSYGQRYQDAISNKNVNNIVRLRNGDVQIDWFPFDTSLGAIALEVNYVSQNGEEQQFLTDVREDRTIVPDVIEDEEEAKITYRTLFKPNANAVDTFYTGYNTVSPAPVFFWNLVAPYDRIANDGRWGILAEWITNDAAKNINGFGGHDTRTGQGLLSFEAGWGTANIVNGKIYQTAVLPAGRYKIDIDFVRNHASNDDGTNNLIYALVAEGAGLPNAIDVPSSAMAYSNLLFINPEQYRMQSFELELTEEKEVSFGFVANLTSTSDQFFNVRLIKFEKVEE